MHQRLILTNALLLTALAANAQDYSGDVFRYSEQPIMGTARFQGLGGNHAALGGDASNAFGNAAGLAFYNRSELSISPSVRLQNASGNFLGQTTTSNKATPFLGTASLIFAGQPQNGATRGPRRTVFGITYSRQASLGYQFALQGRNNRSSIADSYVQDANGVSSTEINGQYDPPPANVAYPGNNVSGIIAAAYQLYLINPTTTNGTQYFRFDQGVPVNQAINYTATGAVSQLGLSLASNFGDKFYVGGNLGFAFTRFTYSQTIGEQFIGGRYFNSLQENTDYTASGNGINLSLGAIYKIDQNLQVGANIITPTWSTRSFSETTNQTLAINQKSPFPSVDANGNPGTTVLTTTSIPVAPNDFNFSISTPLRASGGITYLFGRSGFLTATVDYVNYTGMRVGTTYLSADQNQNFRNNNTANVKAIYKNTVNFRLGGEYRNGMFRVRAGGAYLPSAYQTSFDQLAKDGDRNTFLLSGGVGVRNERFFADLGVARYVQKSGFSPYSLNNASDTPSAILTNNVTNLTLSAGVFF